jgi:hypothetical protein
LQEENAALRKYINDTADLVEFAKNVRAIPRPYDSDTIP